MRQLGGTDFSDKFMQQQAHSSCGKMMTLQLLLRKWRKQGHKVLLFSNLTSMLDLLQCFCVTEGHNYLRLDGSTPASGRQLLVDEYNSSPHIFIL